MLWQSKQPVHPFCKMFSNGFPAHVGQLPDAMRRASVSTAAIRRIRLAGAKLEYSIAVPTETSVLMSMMLFVDVIPETVSVPHGLHRVRLGQSVVQAGHLDTTTEAAVTLSRHGSSEWWQSG